MPKKTTYNPEWEDSGLFPEISKWIQKDTDSEYFRCKYCPGSRLKLSNMGITAVRSHMKVDAGGKKSKHNRNKEAIESSRKQSFFVKPNSNINEVSTTDAIPDAAADVSVVEDNSPSSTPSSSQKKQTTLRLDTAPKEVLDAWILWALDTVISHRSMNSSGNKGKLFRKMFPDDPVAASFGDLSRGKLTYIINFGLSVYFKTCIMQELVPKNRLPPRFTSSFDESFNKVTSTKQMDIHVSYFNEESRRVTRHYIGAQFLGHATAEDTMNDFKKAHENLDIVNKLVMLSMDGPNVNWKFLDDLGAYRKEENPEAPLLLIMGSCGLHVLHGAYQTAHKNTTWDVQKVLKALHGIFKKSPARRADYLEDNDIDDDDDDNQMKMYFPLKFCGHRWLENGKALARYLEIDDKVKRFLDKSVELKRRNFEEKDERKPLLIRTMHSNIFPAYIEFSLSVARDIEPFLKIFQAERPLAVFLYSALVHLVLDLMRRFVKQEVISANSQPSQFLKLDLRKEENLLSPESVNIGFGAKRVLKTLKTTEKQEERKFRLEVRSFFATLLEKLFERSPLKYKLTRPISSLSPLEIASKSDDTLEKRFMKLLEILCDYGWLETAEAEKAQKQYSGLLSKKCFKDKAGKFDIYQDRVDDFWAEVLDSPSTVDLENVVWLILIISHGNARVESGFSINEEILQPNQLAHSIVSQRIVYEAVSKAGAAVDVDITPEMIKDVRKSHKLFNIKQKEKQRSRSENQKKVMEKKRKTNELKKAVAEKKAKLDEMKEQVKEFDRDIIKLQAELKK
jgi:hypothetical protein